MKTSLVGWVLGVAAVSALSGGCAEDEVNEQAREALGSSAQALSSWEVYEGARLFFEETFGGNGRTCGTCHSATTGTISPAQVEASYQRNPTGPLFQGDGTDEPGGATFDRLRREATFRIDLPLPPNVALVGSSARTVAVHRGVPTTMNTPAVDPVLMYDGRAPTLEAQAKDAIFGHAGSSAVTDRQLGLIAGFEKLLFNDARVFFYAQNGTAPTLPQGFTDAQKRGRVFFADDATPAVGRCVHCHSGPMLNETSPGFQAATGVPAGTRFLTAFVSELNLGGEAPKTFRFTKPDGTTADVVSSDPGLALRTGDPAHANLFKIPTIWGAKKTAPYFHDNSAKSVDALMRHYQQYFAIVGLPITDQDVADITAYMQLL